MRPTLSPARSGRPSANATGGRAVHLRSGPLRCALGSILVGAHPGDEAVHTYRVLTR